MRQRRLLLGLIGAALVSACAGPAGAPTATPASQARTAQVAEVDNDVRARGSQDQAWESAAIGQIFGVGGGVLTGDDSRTRLDLTDGSIIRIASNTEFRLVALPAAPEDTFTRLRVEAGRVWVQVTRLLAGARVEVETPSGVATVRGSFLSVAQATAGPLVITCLEGECRLRNPASAAEVTLQPGQQSTIAAPGQDPVPPQSMTPDQYQDWLLNVPEAAAAVQSLLSRITPTPPAPAGLSLGGGPAGSETNPVFGLDAQGGLHLAWESRSRRPSGDYLHRQRHPDGAWSEAVNLTSDFEFLYGSLALRRGPDGALCALWNGARTGTSDIGLYRTCLTDGAWPPAEQIAGGSVTARDFDFQYTAPGGLGAIYLTGVGTLNFTPADLAPGQPPAEPIRLSDDNVAFRGALAVDAAGGLHAVWVRFGEAGSDPSTLVHRFSGDGGGTWSAPETVSDAAHPTDNGALRLLADSAGAMHLLWSGGGQLFYRRWGAGGWEAALALPVARSFNTGSQSLALDPAGRPQAIWQDGQAVWLSALGADGAWSEPLAVAPTGTTTGSTAFVIDSQGVRHIAWLDGKAGAPAETDIRYTARP